MSINVRSFYICLCLKHSRGYSKELNTYFSDHLSSKGKLNLLILLYLSLKTVEFINVFREFNQKAHVRNKKYWKLCEASGVSEESKFFQGKWTTIYFSCFYFDLTRLFLRIYINIILLFEKNFAKKQSLFFIHHFFGFDRNKLLYKI